MTANRDSGDVGHDLVVPEADYLVNVAGLRGALVPLSGPPPRGVDRFIRDGRIVETRVNE